MIAHAMSTKTTPQDPTRATWLALSRYAAFQFRPNTRRATVFYVEVRDFE